MPLSFANLPDAKTSNPLSFDDLPDARPGNSDLDFGSLPDAKGPSFGNVQAGVSSSPSFANVQGGSQTANQGPSIFKKFTDTAGNLINTGSDIGGLMETAANFESQGIAIPAGGASRLGVMAADTLIPKALRPIPLPTPDEAQQATTEALTYTPQSEAGQKLTEVSQYPFEKLAEGGQYLGQATLEATGSPALATAVDTAVQVVPLALGHKVVEGFRPRAPEATRAATEAYGQAEAAGKAPWEATEDALRAIQESDSKPSTVVPGDLNLSPEERVPPSPETLTPGNEGIPSVKKTDSKISGDNLQALNDADLEAAQRAAWGGDFSHLPDATPEETPTSGLISTQQTAHSNVLDDPHYKERSEIVRDLVTGKIDLAEARARAGKLGKEPAPTTTAHPLFDDLVPQEEAPAALGKTPLSQDPSVTRDEMGYYYRDGKLVGMPKETARPRTEEEVAPTRATPEETKKFQSIHDAINTKFNTADKAWNFLSKGSDHIAEFAKTILSSPNEDRASIPVKAVSPDDLLTSKNSTEQLFGQGWKGAASQSEAPLGLYQGGKVYVRGAGFSVNGLDRATLAHELLHSEILGKIKQLRQLHEGIGDADTGHLHPKTRGALEAYRELERTREALANNPDLTEGKGVPVFYKHAVSNVDELTSVAMTDPSFRRYLDNVKMGTVSAWSKIKDLWGKMLGVNGANKRVLDHIAEHVNTIVRYNPEAVAMEGRDSLPAASAKERVSREDIDKQAQAAISRGADAEAVKNRQMQLYREHGHEPAPTSTKNAVRDAERAAEGRDPILKEAAKSNQATLDAAKATLEKNPNRANEVIARLNENGVHSISAEDEAVLLIHKVALRNMRDEASNIINDPKASDAAKWEAQTTWTETEARINQLDQATEASGREWGRLGQFRQRLLRSDYSLDAMERRARTAAGGSLTPEKQKMVRDDHEAIKSAQAEVDKTQAAIQSAHEDSGVKYTYDSLVKEMTKQLKSAKKKGTFLETLKKNADESRDWFKKNLSRSSAGVDPAAFFHLARIGAYHIANGAVKFADWLGKMKAELGEHFGKLEDSMPAVFKAAKEQHAFGATETKPRLRAKKELDPNNITHKDVYDLARAHILNGVHGEDAVMKAVHGDLKDYGLSERDVRRLFSEYGEAKFPSKEADKAELREIRSLVQMQESIDRINEGLPALKSGVQRDKATQIVREKRRQLNDLLKAQEAKNGLSPEKLVTYQEMRARNLRNQIEDLQKEIATGEKKVRKPTPPDSAEVTGLKAERDRLKDELKKIEEAKNPPPSPEEKYQAQRAKGIQRQLDEVYKRIQANDYEPRKREIKELDAANRKAAYKLYQAKNLFNRHKFELEMERRPTWKKALGSVQDTVNLARAVMTSWDLSATLRQGGFVTLGHPVRATKALIASIKAARSEEYAYQVQRDIESRPNFYKYKEAKLDLTLGSGHVLEKQEEQFMSRWLEKNAPVEGQLLRNTAKRVKNILLAPTRASERAFRTFLNKLRADSFDEMLATLAKSEKPSTEEMRAIANYINVATGRGKIGKTNTAAVGLNTVFFAPRLVASRFNLLAGQPLYGGTLRTRAMVAKEYARFLTGVGVVYALGSAFHNAFGNKDEKFLETDPRSSNFGKMHFGNTWIDPLAGLGQVSTFVGREVMGETKTQSGKIEPLRADFKPANLFRDKPDNKGPAYGRPNAADVLFNFARMKLAPVPGVAVNLVTGKNVIGQPVTPQSELINVVTPMSLQNIKSIMQEHGIPEGTAITLLDMLGMSVQQRTPYKKQPETKNGN